jgi:maltose-binding protein MalE
LQLYWPDESDPSIIDGSWKIPPVKKVSCGEKAGSAPTPQLFR